MIKILMNLYFGHSFKNQIRLAGSTLVKLKIESFWVF